jgi:hypothetical protein
MAPPPHRPRRPVPLATQPGASPPAPHPPAKAPPPPGGGPNEAAAARPTAQSLESARRLWLEEEGRRPTSASEADAAGTGPGPAVHQPALPPRVPAGDWSGGGSAPADGSTDVRRDDDQAAGPPRATKGPARRTNHKLGGSKVRRRRRATARPPPAHGPRGRARPGTSPTDTARGQTARRPPTRPPPGCACSSARVRS